MVEALLVAERFRGTIDLLLSDVVMSAMSGPNAFVQHAARPAMKILFMSGYTDDTVVKHGVETREAAFLQKPLSRSCC